MTVEQAVDQMQIAGSTAAGTNRKIAGQMRFGTRRKSGHFFVPHMDPFDVFAATHYVGQAVETVADDAEYALHTGSHQGIYELIGDGSNHLLLLDSVAAIY